MHFTPIAFLFCAILISNNQKIIDFFENSKKISINKNFVQKKNYIKNNSIDILK